MFLIQEASSCSLLIVSCDIFIVGENVVGFRVEKRLNAHQEQKGKTKRQIKLVATQAVEAPT